MLQTIHTPADVVTFARHLIFDQGINFHPDTDFTEYIEKDGREVFLPEQASTLDHLLAQAHQVCEEAGVDIYELTSPLLWERLGVQMIAE